MPNHTCLDALAAPTAPTVFDYEDATTIINDAIMGIGIYRSIKDQNTRIPSILISAFFLLQGKKALLSLLRERELTPAEIVALEELSRRNGRVADEIKATITKRQFDDAIEVIRVCANSKEINPAIWSQFASELDIDTLLDQVDCETDYDYSMLFPREQRNASLVIRKTAFNYLYQAADQSERSVVAQASESFCNKRDLKKAKLAILKSNEFVEEILGDADRNRLVDLFRDELLVELA